MLLYQDVCRKCSKLVTLNYSTSFSLGIRAFQPRFRMPVYAIYGFVRFADEIVDSFHGHNKAVLLKRFREDTDLAIEEGISLNPVLMSFQEVVREYRVDRASIDAFLDSMEMDLSQSSHDNRSYDTYIYGSAEVVGLMCLRVFCEGDEEMYHRLKDGAKSLGAAFQKVNFLRDMQSDFDDRGRIYFPGVDFEVFRNEDKRAIEQDIEQDFDRALAAIRQLPKGARLGVHLAYVYYWNLFKKIKRADAAAVKRKRFRVNDGRKILLLLTTTLRHRLNMM